MKSYMVGYDLNSPGQNYDKLIQALKSYPNWWHYLDSTWIVKTDASAAQIRDHLVPFIDTNDELLVARVSRDAAWLGFDERGSEWLKDNL